MRTEKGKVSDIRLAYIGGGSRGWAWKFMTDLAMEASMGGEVVLYDIDQKAAEANQIIGNKIHAMAETVGDWKYSVAESLQEALTGADFVVISILPGTFDEMAVDVHMPERLGIYQSVGDTAGPGGMIRALRTLPMFVPIAEGIRDYCPDAWVINYTNPMSLCVQVLYHVFPEIKAFGCCHEVFGTQCLLGEMVTELLGVENPERRDIHVNVLGINHFTWFNEASYKGVDLMELYREFVEKHYEEGFVLEGHSWQESPFACAHRVKMDLFRRYGCIAAAGDRHLVEFMPGDEYLADPETVSRWKYSLTPVDWRKNELKERLAKSEELVKAETVPDLTPSGEEGVLLMKALVGLERVVSNVNIPNKGQVTNLPLGAIVETNAVFAKNNIKPLMVGAIPEEICALILPHVENHQRILKAALNCELQPVVDAFCEDPNVKAKCQDRAAIAKLAEDMIAATKEYLPEGWK